MTTKTNTKTDLRVTIRKSTCNYFAVDTYRNENNRKCANNIRKCATLTNEHDTQTIPDTVTACFMHYAPMFAYTATKTVYCKYASEKVHDMMSYLATLMYRGYEQRTIFDTEKDIDYFDSFYFENRTEAAKDTNYYRQLQFFLDDTMEEVKLHTYHMETMSDGRRHRVECIPYTTHETTANGRMKCNDDITVHDDDALDLVQVALEAMIELYRFGVLQSFSDVSRYRVYVYKKINRYIMSQRKRYAIEQTALLWYDDDDTEKIVDIKTVDKRIDKIERDTVHDKIIDILRSKARKNCNIENMIFVYQHYYIDNDSITEIAHDLRVDRKTIRQYKTTIEKTLECDEVRNALHDLLA